MSNRNRTFQRCAGSGLALAIAASVAMIAATAMAADPPWLDKSLLAAAKKDTGTLNVYSSTNEGEGLPLWKLFTDATGIKVNYVRGSDSQLYARSAIEQRAGKQEWDLLQTTGLQKLPPSMFHQFEPPEAKNLEDGAKDKGHRWYGVYANYNAPGYNTKLVKASELPKTYEDFTKHPEWKGKVAIDFSDNEWLKAMFTYYGEKKGRALVTDIVKVLKPAVTKGHLAMARSTGAGEYAIELNQYINLTLNVKFKGQPIDYWVMDPVAVFYGQIGVNAKSARLHAAMLAENFAISKQAQTFLAKFGRIPTRDDVESKPPGIVKQLKSHKVIPTLLTAKEDREWSKTFKEIFQQ
jgi:iron(III) transport system substrate-binding protein